MPQDEESTEDGAYDMSAGLSVVRKPGALVFLPSEDEWYKAGYYKRGGTSAGYWNYPTESDTVPTGEAPPGTDLANGSANFWDGGYVDTTYYTTVVGAYNTEDPPATYVSDGAYGTFDQGGNVWEWNEADTEGDGSHRGLRGGSCGHGDLDYLHAANPLNIYATDEDGNVGFRLAAVSQPEPVPAVSKWGLMVMTLVVLSAGTVVLIRIRARLNRA